MKHDILSEHKSWRDLLPIHPAAELFPMMTEPELVELGEDIKARGLLHPLTIYRGARGKAWLLDGRNRLTAMERVGVKFELREFVGRWEVIVDGTKRPTCMVQGVDPNVYVVSVNIRRRHLTSEQKHDLIKKLLKANPSKSNRDIGKMVGASHHTVEAVRQRSEASGQIAHIDHPKTTNKNKTARKSTAKEPAQAVISAAARKAAYAAEEAQLDFVEKHVDFSEPDGCRIVTDCFEALAALIVATEKFPDAVHTFHELPIDYKPPFSRAAITRQIEWLVRLRDGLDCDRGGKRVAEKYPATSAVSTKRAARHDCPRY